MLTGLSLGCTLGCKMVGLFTFMTVGAAVLWDLWGLLDVRKEGHTMVGSLCPSFGIHVDIYAFLNFHTMCTEILH